MTFKEYLEYFEALFLGANVAMAVMGMSMMFSPKFKNFTITITVIAIWFGLNVAAAMIVLRRMYAG